MQITVSTPVMMLAYQSCPHPDVIFLKNGRAKVNMRAMVAMESMLYTTVLMVICVSSCFHLLCSVVFG